MTSRLKKRLIQAPLARILRCTRNSDSMLADLCQHKSIAIVGNAKSLLRLNLGNAIDHTDIVARLNYGHVHNPASQGTRTHIIGLSVPMKSDELHASFQSAVPIWLTPRFRHFSLTYREHLRRVIFYDLSAWNHYKTTLGKRPSSGFMLTDFLIRKSQARMITIYGFDFGQTQTFYNAPSYSTPHNYEGERQFMEEWERQSLIEIVR